MVLKDNGRGKCRDGAGGRTNDSRWAAAEKEVSRLLSSLLLDGCLVLNDVPFPYGNLDHVVIRPDGAVFLIETKSHRGKITWDGKQLLINKRPFSSNPICQINRSIRWVRHIAKRLFGHNPWIVAILAFPNAQVLIRRPVRRINVLNSKDILGFIKAYRR
jgi:hypothetical protein